jgi:hypothetical protein
MRPGTSGSAVRSPVVPGSRARRPSLPNSCAGSGSERSRPCAAAERGTRVPPPTRVRPIRLSVGPDQPR